MRSIRCCQLFLPFLFFGTVNAFSITNPLVDGSFTTKTTTTTTTTTITTTITSARYQSKSPNVVEYSTCTTRQEEENDNPSMESKQEQEQQVSVLDPATAKKFKIVTCMSTSCTKKRKALGMDPLATFGEFYSRIKEGPVPMVQIEEGPCLGSCKEAPCVGIEHEDFVGCVALEGMMEMEFDRRVFHRVITEEDADRVWSCVENAIQVMTREEQESTKSDDSNDINLGDK